ncbi:MAG: DUF1572 domain-containing protein [Chitinophagaceae bacterium]
MKSPLQLANRFREVILNGTWVANTNFKDQLSNVSWEQATQKIDPLNTIAALTSHIHYYIAGILNVLEGGTLDIKDIFSFDFPPVKSQEDWQKVLNQLWSDSEKFASLVEQMPEEKLNEDFADRKYGSYQRNIDAMIEHSYYHLGQIVLIKKMILKKQ